MVLVAYLIDSNKHNFIWRPLDYIIKNLQKFVWSSSSNSNWNFFRKSWNTDEVVKITCIIRKCAIESFNAADASTRTREANWKNRKTILGSWNHHTDIDGAKNQTQNRIAEFMQLGEKLKNLQKLEILSSLILIAATFCILMEAHNSRFALMFCC